MPIDNIAQSIHIRRLTHQPISHCLLHSIRNTGRDFRLQDFWNGGSCGFAAFRVVDVGGDGFDVVLEGFGVLEDVWGVVAGDDRPATVAHLGLGG